MFPAPYRPTSIAGATSPAEWLPPHMAHMDSSASVDSWLAAMTSPADYNAIIRFLSTSGVSLSVDDRDRLMLRSAQLHVPLAAKREAEEAARKALAEEEEAARRKAAADAVQRGRDDEAERARQNNALQLDAIAAMQRAPRGWSFKAGTITQLGGLPQGEGWVGPDGHFRATGMDDKPWEREHIPVDSRTGMRYTEGAIVEGHYINKEGKLGDRVPAAVLGTNAEGVALKGIAGGVAPTMFRRTEQVAASGRGLPAASPVRRWLLVALVVALAAGAYFFVRRGRGK